MKLEEGTISAIGCVLTIIGATWSTGARFGTIEARVEATEQALREIPENRKDIVEIKEAVARIEGHMDRFNEHYFRGENHEPSTRNTDRRSSHAHRR